MMICPALFARARPGEAYVITRDQESLPPMRPSCPARIVLPGSRRESDGVHTLLIPPDPSFIMLIEGTVLGWALIVLGAVMLLIEAYQPGFFIAVPGTVLIILGILLLFGVDIFTSPWGLILGVLTAIVAAAVTVWLYSRLAPGEKPPTTLSRDSLVGLEGVVVREVDDETLAGKVRIGSMEWSARSESGRIPAGRKVVVVHSEGVHIVVKEVS